jgi:SAM-dependent methyltransferase
LASPDEFAGKIATFNEEFDAIISSHNIEHCNERIVVFLNMIKALKPGGRIYLSFPCEDSVHFPRRAGTLNYYDDDTHNDLPPDFTEFLKILHDNNFTILFEVKKYKPFLMWLIGIILEPYSRYRNKTFSYTWAYYGFESIIWAVKNK